MEAARTGDGAAGRAGSISRRSKRVTVAYVDTSALVAIAFGEPGSAALGRRLGTFSVLLSSNLLEAELRAAYSREERRFSQAVVSGIEWILPDRPLASEFTKVLEAGYLRGADLWHVATALYAARRPSEIWFVTLDMKQRTIAAALGFQVPDPDANEYGRERPDPPADRGECDVVLMRRSLRGRAERLGRTGDSGG